MSAPTLLYTPLVERVRARYRRVVAVEDMTRDDVWWSVWREPGAEHHNRTKHTSMADAVAWNRDNGYHDAWVELEQASDLF